MKQPTVLHVIDTGGPGGAESVFAALSGGLRTAGMRIVPVVSRPGWLSQQLLRQDLEPVFLSGKGRFNLGYAAALFRLARSNSADLLITHLFGPAVYGSLVGRAAGLPVMAVLHGQSDLSAGDRLLALKGWVLRGRRTQVVCVSEPLRSNVVSRLMLDPARSCVIPNGVDMARFAGCPTDSIRRELRLPEDAILVGAVGNARPPKAYDHLLRCASRVCSSSPQVHFVVAGDFSGALGRSLTELRAQLGLEARFHLLGLRSDVPTVLAGVDIFVLASDTEGFSLACVEAMAAGKAIVATRCGGPEDILEHGVTGMLVAPRDADELASALLRFAADPASRVAFGQRARRRAEADFGLAGTIRSYEQLARRLICPNGGGPPPS